MDQAETWVARLRAELVATAERLAKQPVCQRSQRRRTTARTSLRRCRRS